MSEIVIYGKQACSFCDQAKQACETKGRPFEYLELNKDYTLEELQAKAPASRSFPAIFINEEWIGGFQELIKVLVK